MTSVTAICAAAVADGLGGRGRGAFDVDQLAAEGDGPSGAVGGDRPGPPVPLLDLRHDVEVAVVVDDIAGQELVSVNCRHVLDE